jgi:2-polyprenyl-3-methyl-5-hydroxy-6-metoxy-1,4-benzoquinol methylase
MRAYIMRTLARHFVTSGTALEMGCFKGDFTSLLVPLFDELTVIEAVDDLLREARTRVGDQVKFIHSTFEQFDPGAQKFANVFLVHTLEHVDDPVGLLQKVGRWLTTEGRLFIVVPNAQAASRQIAVHMGLIEHNEAVLESERRHGHRRTYAFDTLLRDIRAAGLCVYDSGGLIFKPFANMQFDRMLREGILTLEYLEGCYRLGQQHPTLCASIYAVVGNQTPAKAANTHGGGA